MSPAAPDGDASAAFGTWVGAHALGLFVVLLALALVATVMLWRRTGPARPDAGGTRCGIALALVGISVALFAGLAWLLHPGSDLTRFDLAVSAAVQGRMPPLALRLFGLLTHAGDAATRTALAVVVGAGLLVLRRPLLMAGFVGGLAGNGALTGLLKHAYGRDRPLQPPGGMTVAGYSFPSGHSAGSVVAFGLLAYLALRLLPPRWHLPALCSAVAMTVSVSVSRVVLRAHFPSDVLAGAASGVAWLVVCVVLLDSARHRWPRRPAVG